MSENIYDILESGFARMRDSENKLKSLLGEDWKKNLGTTIEGSTREVWDQYNILEQSRNDVLTCIKPTTIIPGVEKEEDADDWKDMDRKYAYPILDYLKRARDLPEMNTFGDDDLDAEDFEEALTKLINFRYFKPDHWFKKEGEFPPLHIKGDSIPTWLSNRYREAVYSYIYGFNNAAVAMCRSIVEAIINDKYGDKFKINVKLIDKIEFIMKTVKDTKHKQVVWSTGHVREWGNDVLHDIKKSCSENKAKEALLKTRSFISMVY